jgi:hypothetical protein
VSIAVTSLSTSSCPGSTGFRMCVTTMAVAVEDFVLSQVKIYPNPVTDYLFFDGVIEDNITFSLYNIVGKVVKSGTVSTQSINLSTISEGVYILRLLDEKSRLYKEFKVIKN